MLEINLNQTQNFEERKQRYYKLSIIANLYRERKYVKYLKGIS